VRDVLGLFTASGSLSVPSGFHQENCSGGGRLGLVDVSLNGRLPNIVLG